jgi:hypothetical protein
LNRTSTTTYAKDCNPTNYGKGEYALCQVGDLSGKFGYAVETFTGSKLFVRSTILTDEQPPYVSNFLTSDSISTKWSSIVFHCSTGARLVCAKFQLIADGQPSACTFPNTYKKGIAPIAIAVIVISVVLFSGIVTLLALFFTGYLSICTAKKGDKSEELLMSNIHA